MQTNTDLNIPDFVKQNDRFLFAVSGMLALLSFCAAIYFKYSILFLLPLVMLLPFLVILNFRIVFFLMLFCLPMSIESYIGSFGTDLPSEPLVIILAACTLFYLVYNKIEFQNASFHHPIFLFIIMMFFWSAFVTLFSTNIFLSIKYLLAKSWYLLGFLVLPIILLRDKRNIRIFFWSLFIPTLFSVVYVMIRHAWMKFTFDSITESVHPIYRNHVNYAVFITMLLPFIFLAKTWYDKKSFKYFLLKYSILLFLASIYFSFTRGAWLAVAAMVLYYWVLKRNWTKYVIIGAILSAFIFCMYILKDNNYLKYAPNYEHTIYHDELAEHLTSTFEMEDMSTVERFYRWIAAINLFKEHPMVGVGPNNFVSNYKQYSVTAYETYISDNEEKSTVHNYFLLLLTEQGVPALLLYVALLVIVFLTAQKTYTNASEENKKNVAAITLCLIAFLLNNTLSDLVEANKIGSLFYMSLALLLNFSTRNIILEDEKIL